MKPIRILVVDDNESMRDAIRLTLRSNPAIEVIGECTNGQEAITSASELLPDIIFMDIEMHPVNGFEATRKIRRLHPEIKIIGHSFHNNYSYASNMINAGASGYLSKASKPQEYFDAIFSVIKGERYLSSDIMAED